MRLFQELRIILLEQQSLYSQHKQTYACFMPGEERGGDISFATNIGSFACIVFLADATIFNFPQWHCLFKANIKYPWPFS